MFSFRALFAWLGVGCAAVTLGVWLLQGANTGWSRTSFPVEKTDEVTGLTYREYERRFQPGVDFLAVGLFMAAGLGGVSWFAGRRLRRGGD